MADLVEKTGYSERELYRRIKAGIGPTGTRLSHRVTVYDEAEVEAWQEALLAKAQARPTKLRVAFDRATVDLL